MKKFLDTDHPFFRPVWIRVLVVVVTLGWAVLEFVTGAPFWGVIFGGLGAYAIWGFFFDFDPDRARSEPAQPKPDQTDTPPDA